MPVVKTVHERKGKVLETTERFAYLVRCTR